MLSPYKERSDPINLVCTLIALLEKMDGALKTSWQLGYAKRKKLIEAAVVAMLRNLSGNHEKSSDEASKNREN